MAFILNPPGISGTRGFGAPTVSNIKPNDFVQSLFTDLEEVFFNPNDFTEIVEYTHKLEPNTILTYRGIFDDPHMSMSPGNNEFNSIRPQVQIPEHELKYEISKGDKLTIKGKSYLVRDKITDGVGVITVYLGVRKGA